MTNTTFQLLIQIQRGKGRRKQTLRERPFSFLPKLQLSTSPTPSFNRYFDRSLCPSSFCEALGNVDQCGQLGSVCNGSFCCSLLLTHFPPLLLALLFHCFTVSPPCATVPYRVCLLWHGEAPSKTVSLPSMCLLHFLHFTDILMFSPVSPILGAALF